MNKPNQEITQEQAFNNIAMAIERDFVGKRQEHILLEQSLMIIKKMIDKNNLEKAEVEKDKIEKDKIEKMVENDC